MGWQAESTKYSQEALTGAVLGAIAMAAVGFMINAKSAKS
jgi:hypothetical protein